MGIKLYVWTHPVCRRGSADHTGATHADGVTTSVADAASTSFLNQFPIAQTRTQTGRPDNERTPVSYPTGMSQGWTAVLGQAWIAAQAWRPCGLCEVFCRPSSQRNNTAGICSSIPSRSGWLEFTGLENDELECRWWSELQAICPMCEI